MADLISRSAVREELQSLQVTVNGLRAGKGVLKEFMEQFRASVLRIIDEQPRVGEWIPCSERLPECNIEIVEGVFSSDAVNVTIVDENGRVSSSIDFMVGDKWSCCAKTETVTHWQPLPEPYQEGKPNE